MLECCGRLVGTLVWHYAAKWGELGIGNGKPQSKIALLNRH